MASLSSPQTNFPQNSVKQYSALVGKPSVCSITWNRNEKSKKKRPLTVVAAVGDVSSDGTTYLIAGAVAVALLGTAFPILFSRKDTYVNYVCPPFLPLRFCFLLCFVVPIS